MRSTVSPLLAAAVSFAAAAEASAPPAMVTDIFRAMESSSVDKFPTEDDDVADLGGVIKYVHTEILVEHLLPPFRRMRKYNIDVIRRKRFKIRNPPELLRSTSFVDFGPFITFDWGVATNTLQIPFLRRHGDFVGIQSGCDIWGTCDPRFPALHPYYWFSVGNWCPNLPWSQKGSKRKPNPECLRREGWGPYLTGGLCPGGSDGAGVMPAAEPTGTPGCVYSYGASQVVRLDEVAGITAEDCGRRRCKDWADFRANCTQARYRRMFKAPSGHIIKVPYCVEYDIHPACDNCQTSTCRELQSSGQVVELGLPFWRGRCDAQANEDRREAVAAAFGIQGALVGHRTFDKGVLSLDIPCVSRGSALCRPAGGASGGPYCSRSFSGVCQGCYIPGTARGPVPTPRFCPLDILSAVDYRDATKVPPPVCRSRRPRDLCCLYTGTCDGESDPARAALDDDGLALVAGRQSTADMVVFLRRAVQARLLAGDAASDEAAFHWAAYHQWGLAPLGRTLAQALADVGNSSKAWKGRAHPVHSAAAAALLATGEKATATDSPTTSTATATASASTSASTTARAPTDSSTTSTAMATTSTSTSAATTSRTSSASTARNATEGTEVRSAAAAAPAEGKRSEDDCFQSGISFVPLDMPASMLSVEADAAACQARCARELGCAYFSYATLSRTCHLPPSSAFRWEGSIGWVSGPFRCWRDIDDKELSCLERGTAYSPSMSSHTTHFAKSMFPHSRQAVVACRRLCASVAGCAHFTVDLHMRVCSLADASATKTHPVWRAVAGPPRCANKVHEDDREGDADAVAGEHSATFIFRKFLVFPDAVAAAMTRSHTIAAVGWVLFCVFITLAVSGARLWRMRGRTRPLASIRALSAYLPLHPSSDLVAPAAEPLVNI